MPGIDRLVSRSLSTIIKKQLESKTLKNLERELFFEKGMSIKLSMENFHDFVEILINHYKNNPQNFVDECFSRVIKIKKMEDNYIFTVIEKDLSEKIFSYFGDFECRSILSSVMATKLTVPEILKISQVLKSPAYRKIENLLLDGLLIESGKILSNNKRVSQYTCIFDRVSVVIKRDSLTLEGLVNKKSFLESTIVKSGLLNY